VKHRASPASENRVGPVPRGSSVVPVAADCFGTARAVAGEHAETQDESHDRMRGFRSLERVMRTRPAPEITRGARPADEAAATTPATIRRDPTERVRA
jgi:hypothetical protein